jgi:hypothetical protein
MDVAQAVTDAAMRGRAITVVLDQEVEMSAHDRHSDFGAASVSVPGNVGQRFPEHLEQVMGDLVRRVVDGVVDDQAGGVPERTGGNYGILCRCPSR